VSKELRLILPSVKYQLAFCTSHFKACNTKEGPGAANKVFLAAGQQTQTEKTPVFCISCSNILVLNNQKVFCEHSSVLPPDVGSEIHIFKLQPSKTNTLKASHSKALAKSYNAHTCNNGLSLYLPSHAQHVGLTSHLINLA